MVTSDIKAVLFDLNGVLVDVDEFKRGKINKSPLLYKTILYAKSRFKIGVVTNCSDKTAKEVIRTLGLSGKFDVVVTKNDVEEKVKPSPAPYIVAIQKLDLLPFNCLAIENTDRGIMSAIEAGVDFIRLHNIEDLSPSIIKRELERIRL